MRFRTSAVACVVCSVLWGAPAMAQTRHVVDARALQQAVAVKVSTDQQNRDVVLDVLHRSDVRTLASHLGLDVSRAEDAVSTLSSAELSRVAGPARIASADLAGGSNQIIISTTTLLLIIIIVLLVVR